MALPIGPKVQPGPDGLYTVTLIPGDVPGPYVFASLKSIFAAAHAPINWEEIPTPPFLTNPTDAETFLDQITTSIQRTKLAIKGSFRTSSLPGAPRSINITLRQNLDLFAAVTHVQNLPGLTTRHKDVNFTLIRENVEGEYVGLEHVVLPGVAAESLKLVSQSRSQRVIEFAYEYARCNGRKKLTVIHKANIMKRADGMFRDMFLAYGQECKARGQGFVTGDMIIDNASMQTVIRPQQFEVVVCPNLYGSILGSIGAGLVGGAGVLPAVEVGSDCLVFGMGTRSTGMEEWEEGEDNVNEGAFWANPTAVVRAGVLLLRYLGLEGEADRIERALVEVIAERSLLTRDLGGQASCQQFAEAVISKLGASTSRKHKLDM